MNVEHFANQNMTATTATTEAPTEAPTETENSTQTSQSLESQSLESQSLESQSTETQSAEAQTDSKLATKSRQSVRLQGIAAPVAQQWKLLEMVQLSDDPTDSQAGAPLQWLSLGGAEPEQQEPILVIGGFQGATNNDNRIIQLMKKAFSSGIIEPTSDIYLCPIINPSSRSKSQHLNSDGVDLMNAFPSQEATAEELANLPIELKSLISWVERISPKAIVTLDSGENLINHSEINEELLEKIAALAEREVLELGQTPEIEDDTEVVYNALGVAINSATQTLNEKESVRRNWDRNIGVWCAEKEIPWINFSINSDKQSFDELKEDWRLNLGPAMKWLFEGPRFNPPEEEPEIPSPTVIPTLDLPPELMNL